MKYLSVSEVSKKWNISERRVRSLLVEGRIKGAIKVSKSWLIPENASKPSDGRNTYQFDEVEAEETENVDFKTYLKRYPNEKGYFGKYGGAYLPKELEKAFQEIYDAYLTICK